MFGMMIRYAIVALAAALAALSGEEARGCNHCGNCGTCCATGASFGCGPRCHRCRRHHGRRCGCCGNDGPMCGPGGLAPSGIVSPMFASPPPPPRPPIVIPRGTIGLTYRQISRLIPDCEHPRTGMIEICGVPFGVRLCIAGMEGYRGDNGVWYFRTVHPLLPCTTFIHTAYLQTAGGVQADYRVFRLIPGRIVTMTW